MAKDKLFVRMSLSRSIWAEVKAKATREARTVTEVVEEILSKYFEEGR